MLTGLTLTFIRECTAKQRSTLNIRNGAINRRILLTIPILGTTKFMQAMVPRRDIRGREGPAYSPCFSLFRSFASSSRLSYDVT